MGRRDCAVNFRLEGKRLGSFASLVPSGFQPQIHRTDWKALSEPLDLVLGSLFICYKGLWKADRNQGRNYPESSQRPFSLWQYC